MAQFMGIKFPFQKGPLAFPAATSDEDLIRESLIQIIMTSKGERLMRTSFGSNAFAFVFENNDDVLKANAQREVREAIGRFEPRVVVTDVDVQQDTEAGEIQISISYIILALNSPQKLTVSVPMP